MTDYSIMMVSDLRNLLSVFFLCAEALFMATHGLVTQPEPHDLQLTSVTRQVSADNSQVEVTVEFTASTRPQTRWSYADKYSFGVKYLKTSRLIYANGIGRASVTYPPHIRMVNLDIGDYSTHYFGLDVYTGDRSNVTKPLNTELTEVTSGHDIIYTRGEAFDVIVKVPRPGHVRNGNYEVLVSPYYVDQVTRKAWTPLDYRNEDYRSFYQLETTYQDDGATVKLSFDTSREDISGFFRVYITSAPYDEAARGLVGLEEYVYFKVHNSSTPGPFPQDYAYVMSEEAQPQTCPDFYRTCYLFCQGIANEIADYKIFKEDENGNLKELKRVKIRPLTVHNSEFYVTLNRYHDYPGTFLCQITSRGGVTANATVTTSRQDH